MKYLKRIFSAFVIAQLFFSSVCAEVLSFENDKLSLTLETQIENDEQMKILALFELKDGWHISWDNPGNAGVPTTFEAKNADVKVLKSSVPEKFVYDDIITQYGYGQKAYYLLESMSAGESFDLEVSWTACRDYCEPEKNVFKIKKETTPDFHERYKTAILTFPFVVQKPIRVKTEKEKIVLSLKDFYDVLCFIPSEKGILDADAKQVLNAKNQLEIDARDLNVLPSKGIIVTKDKAFEVTVRPIQANVLLILALAFLGGIVLNLMPCVFPVLSLKALEMVQGAYVLKKRFLKAGAYVMGVVSSFLGIAGILYILKAGGRALGWGFQLQSPLFVGLMLLLFVLILLYLFDIFHFRLPCPKLMTKASAFNSFLTGFFAVLIASPCTGPFMGVAVGFALAKEASIYFPVFLFLGLGYALPFALLEIFPFWLKRIMPKPGIWMVRLKYVLSLPIFLTVIWLFWVLYHQVSWSKSEDLWQPYSDKILTEALDDGQAVFIDFTAKWCLTCLLNEKMTLSSKVFLNEVEKRRILLLKADWTNQNKEVFEALQNYGRSGVPLYVYYSQDDENYVILPQILTIGNVLDVLNNRN